MSEVVIAVNPDPESRLRFLVRLPIEGGMVLRTSGTWPREKALFCYPAGRGEWPDDPEIVERLPVRSCVRRGAAIDLVLDRARESRSQIVFTKARGRDAVFWQSARTRKQARPNVTVPTARAAGISGLEILVDTRERYGYKFGAQQATVTKRSLQCGDYATHLDDAIVGAVERKSLEDLASSVQKGTLRYALGELAALPRAAVVVEDRYSQIFKLSWIRPALVADGLAELQVRWPTVPIVFAESRQLAEEWTYRYLAAAHAWALTEQAMAERLEDHEPAAIPEPATAQEPSTRDVRNWARANGFGVPDRGKLRPEIWQAWRDANAQG